MMENIRECIFIKAIAAALTEVEGMRALGIKWEKDPADPKLKAEQEKIRTEQKFANERGMQVYKTFIMVDNQPLFRVDFETAKKFYNQGELVAMLPAFVFWVHGDNLKPWRAQRDKYNVPFEFIAKTCLIELCTNMCKKRYGRVAFFVTKENWEKRFEEEEKS